MEYERISPTKKVRVGSKEWKEVKGVKDKLFKITIEAQRQYPLLKDFKYIRVERSGDTITLYIEGKRQPNPSEFQQIIDYLNNPFKVKIIEEIE